MSKAICVCVNERGRPCRLIAGHFGPHEAGDEAAIESFTRGYLPGQEPRPSNRRMTDHDDTPSTANPHEMAAAQAELLKGYPLELLATSSADVLRGIAVERVAECNRLAARVTSLQEEVNEIAGDASSEVAGLKRTIRELRTELDKLRAAAAPVELPASEPPEPWTWEECALANVDDAVTLSLHSVDTLWLDVGEGEEERSFALPFACIEALTGRVLALPPQEDVRGALPEGFSLRMCRSATDGPCDTYSYETRLYADRRAHVSIRPDWTIHQAGLLPGEMEAILRHHLSRPTAPRTEGGGDHGE
jgi:hypothetical protein